MSRKITAQTAQQRAASVDVRLRRAHRLITRVATDAAYVMRGVAERVGEFDREEEMAAVESGDCYDALQVTLVSLKQAIKHANRLLAKTQLLAEHEAAAALGNLS